MGALCATLQRIGHPLPVVDSLLAAVVRVNDAVFATRNVRHFEPTGIRLINPWHSENLDTLAPLA